MKNFKLFLVIVVLVSIFLVVFVWNKNNMLTKNPQPQKACGGIAGIQCPKGYLCDIQDNYPDAMGVCVK